MIRRSEVEVGDCFERRGCHLSGVVVRRCVGPRQGTAEARASHDRVYAEGHERVHVGVAAASTSVPAGYVNNEQERKIYEMKRRSKELGTLNEFLDKYGPPDEVYGRAKAEKAVEKRQAAELMPPGNVTWKPRETWAKVILWDCVCYPLQVPFLFLAWALGFSWGANPPPPEESA